MSLRRHKSSSVARDRSGDKEQCVRPTAEAISGSESAALRETVRSRAKDDYIARAHSCPTSQCGLLHELKGPVSVDV